MAVSPFRRWALSPQTATLALAWARVLAVALAVAALAGAAQLGLAYGLGLVRFTRPLPTGGIWSAQLTWMVWFAALAVLAGAAGGAWMARRHDRPLRLGTRIAVALVAALGATVVVPLTALPARAAELATRNPALDVALAAGLGAVVGLAAAVAVLSLRPVAVNVGAVVAATWLLALVSVAPSLDLTRPAPVVRLGVLDLPTFSDDLRSTAAMLTPSIIVIVVSGVMAGFGRAFKATLRWTALAGPAGAALLALSYLVAGPGPAGDPDPQLGPYTGALISTAAGLVAAIVVATARIPDLRAAAVTVRAAAATLPALVRRPRRNADSPALTTPALTTPAPQEPPAPPAAAPATDDEYLGWVQALGAEDEQPEDEPVRRRLRPGSGEQLQDPELAPPTPPQVPRPSA